MVDHFRSPVKDLGLKLEKTGGHFEDLPSKVLNLNQPVQHGLVGILFHQLKRQITIRRELKQTTPYCTMLGRFRPMPELTAQRLGLVQVIWIQVSYRLDEGHDLTDDVLIVFG
jgi:hypothetical protein